MSFFFKNMRNAPDVPGWRSRLTTGRDVRTTSIKEKEEGKQEEKEEEERKFQKTSKDGTNIRTLPSIASAFQSSLENSSTQSDYEQRRTALLTAERIDSWDRTATETATPAEREAAEIVWCIREHEREVLFGNRPGETVPGPETLDMGGQLLTNHSRIEQSELFKIARQAPKGCQLHIHFNTEIETKEVIQRSRDVNNMYIKSTKALVIPEDYDECEIIFNVFPVTTVSADVFAKEYDELLSSGNEDVWMRWTDFCKKFQEHREEGAEEWVSTKIVLSEEEVYGPYQTLNGIWARFNQGTRCLKGLLSYETVLRWYVGALIDSMVRDGIIYAELRPMLLDRSISTDDGCHKMSQRDQVLILKSELEKKKKQLESKGKLNEFPFGFKLIYCTPRSISKDYMRQELQDCIKLKMDFPELICGFDLVGAEDRPNSIKYYRDELLAFTETCKNLNISIPFMFHAGETLLDTGGSNTSENSNLYEALLLNAKRVGHGFALTKHPHLARRFKEQRICIELCPTSNEMLHLCRNIKEHPFPQLLNFGIPCTLNSDNPALFRRTFPPGSSLSLEFYQVMVGSPAMSLHGWRQLAEWSIEFSCLSDQEKMTAMSIFRHGWEKFCAWIISTYRERASNWRSVTASCRTVRG